jgi:hypothetical protein
MKIKQILALFAFLFPVLTTHASQLIWTRMTPLNWDGWPFTGVLQSGSEIHIFSIDSDILPNVVYTPSEILTIDVPTYCVTRYVKGATGYDYASSVKLIWEYTDPRSGFAGTSDHWNPELGTGWIEGDPFGEAWVRWYPWVYDTDDGWQYVIDSGIAWNANAWWIYSYTRGDWFWTTREVHPWAWSHQQQDWITAPF